VQQRQAPGPGDLFDGRCQARADRRKSSQAGEPFRLQNLASVARQAVERLGSTPIRIDPKGIGMLLGEQFSALAKALGGFAIEGRRLSGFLRG
jgi:hypothetical protein